MEAEKQWRSERGKKMNSIRKLNELTEIREEKNKAHICLCFHVYPPIMGGAEASLEKLANYLVKKGHRVTVVCSDRNLKADEKNKKEEIINGVHVLYVKSYFDLMKVPFMPSYNKVLSSINPDLIHVVGTVPGVSDVAVFNAKRRGIPSVLNYKFDGNAQGIIGSFLAWVYNITINRMTVKKADKIIATGKSYAESSIVLKKVLNKVNVIPNGIDLNTFNPNYNVSKVRKKYGIPKGKIILWVGRFVKYKGLEYLIKAMNNVDNATLIIVGKGQLESSLKSLVNNNNLTEKVKFLGFVKNSDLPELYCLSDIYVLSSITRGENFGISVLEAMGCGTPVVVSDLPGVRDFVTEDVGIKVQLKNSLELAESINRLLSNKRLRDKLGFSAAKKAKNYSWDDLFGKFYSIYNEILNPNLSKER